MGAKRAAPLNSRGCKRAFACYFCYLHMKVFMEGTVIHVTHDPTVFLEPYLSMDGIHSNAATQGASRYEQRHITEAGCATAGQRPAATKVTWYRTPSTFDVFFGVQSGPIKNTSVCVQLLAVAAKKVTWQIGGRHPHSNQSAQHSIPGPQRSRSLAGQCRTQRSPPDSTSQPRSLCILAAILPPVTPMGICLIAWIYKLLQQIRI